MGDNVRYERRYGMDTNRRLKDMYFGLETYCTLLRVKALNYSCYDIPSTPKVWNVLARNQSQLIQVRNLTGKNN